MISEKDNQYSKMSLQINVLATKLTDLNLNPETFVVSECDYHKLFYYLHTRVAH